MTNQNIIDTLDSAVALLAASQDGKLIPVWQAREALAHVRAAIADIEIMESRL